MVNLSTEKILYHYVRNDPFLMDIVTPRFFENKDLQICYEEDVQFFKKYKKIPTKEQLKEILFQKKISNFIEKDEKTDENVFQNNKLTILFDVNIDEYSKTWLDETIEAWIEWKNLDFSLFDSISLIKSTKLNAENIKDIVNQVKEIIQRRNSIDLSFDMGLEFTDPESHYQDENNTFTCGYDWINKMLGGGLSLKTLIAFIGRPKVGKCCLGTEKIKIRNKKNNEIKEVTLEEFYKLSKRP